jgi:hypothetical protein
MARLSGDEIKVLIDGATYLFLNEYELALAIPITLSSEVAKKPCPSTPSGASTIFTIIQLL